MDTLINCDWLNQHLDDPDLIVLDCSVYQVPDDDGGFHNVSGLDVYMKGHIPSAGFADLKGDLCDASSAIEFAVPSPEQFCEAMGALGVGDNSKVVLYDTQYSAWAARVWWMLRWVGFDNAALLDGGFQAWKSAGLPVTSEVIERAGNTLTPHPRPSLIADRDEVLAAIDDESVQLIDTLPAPFYRGESTIYTRPGHIPTAINICELDLLDESGCFRSDDELAALHEGNHDSRYITYCGGGIMASANAFAMTRLGFNDVAVYTASLQEWAADPNNPMVIDTSPTL